MNFVSKKVRKSVAIFMAVVMLMAVSPVTAFANVAADLAGMLVSPSLNFQRVYNFRFDGTALVVVNNHVHAINSAGQFVEIGDLEWSWYNSSVYELFWEGNLMGVQNRLGNVVVPPVYDDIVLGERGLTLVSQNGVWGIIQLPDYLDNAFGSARAAEIRGGTGPDGFTDVGYEIWSAADDGLEDGFVGELPYLGAARRVVATAVNTDFISFGPFAEFEAFWIYSHEEGVLTRLRWWDFDVEEASTRITIQAQTFRDAPQGENTIIAEFRTADSVNPVRVAAQTFDNPTGRAVRRPGTPVVVGPGAARPAPAPAAVAGTVGTHIATRDVHVRTGPGADYTAMGWIPRDHTVEVLNHANAYWARVQFTANRTGFVNSPFLASTDTVDTQGLPTRTVNTHRLNVRVGAGVNHHAIGVLHYGDVVYELGRVGGWVRVTHSRDGFYNTGYVFARYLR